MNINVLHVRDSGAMLGAENVILELARQSPSLGITPVIGVFSHSDGSATELARQASHLGLETIVIPCNKKFDLGTIKFLRNYIKKHDIHLVHTHGYKEDFYAWLAKATPLLATNHLWKRTTAALKVYAYIDSKVLHNFNKVVAVSAPIQQDMVSVGIKADNTLLIPNGINIEKFTLQGKFEQTLLLKQLFGIPAERIVIGMISSLTQEKGHAKALPGVAEIIKQYPNTHVLVVGAGPELNYLCRQSKTLGIEKNITFAGNRNDIPDLLSLIDIFLLYSSIEGLPIAILEAMAAGKAIIATNVGDVGYAIIDGITGLLLETQNQAFLSQALMALIENEDKRNRLGQAAKERVAEVFSSGSMAKRYARVYRELLA